MRWLFGWRYISSLHSADEAQEGRNSCPLYNVWMRETTQRIIAVHCCDPALSVLVVLLSRNLSHVVSALQSIAFSRSISLAVYCLYKHFILADQISCRSYVCSVYRMRSLAVSYAVAMAVKRFECWERAWEWGHLHRPFARPCGISCVIPNEAHASPAIGHIFPYTISTL